MLTPVIMAGGSGSRLWPLSRQNTPKQFLDLDHSGQTLLQRTLARLAPLEHHSPLIIGNEAHRFQIAEQLRQLHLGGRVILEPAARNTAPAAALAALTLAPQDDPIMLILAADHHVQHPAALLQAITAGQTLAAQGRLVTFGIVPDRPETGYGYIRKGEALSATAWEIDRFTEKPDQQTARDYIASGHYLWNSGIFMARASTYLNELERHAPEILLHCRQALQQGSSDADFIRPDPAAFAACPDDSIDYAVMEHTQSGCVIPLEAGWSDIGSWQALWEISPKDANGNHRSGDCYLLDSHDSLIHAHHRYVAALGLRDCIVVETKDAVLVAAKSHSQQVKEVVAQLKREARPEYADHTHILRPWGEFDTIDSGHRYQVKRITVQPGQQLSLQLHYHRAEHWIVVSGTAQVICGEHEMILSENQSTYIPVGVKHRLGNPGRIPLEVIEVQSGHYLGEDDIVRFTDSYGRCMAAKSGQISS